MTAQALAALDDLIAQAATCAAQLLAKDGELAPCFIVQSETEGRIYAAPWRDDRDKRLMVQWLREEFARFGAVRYVAVLESWMVKAKGSGPEEARETLGGVMPRNHPDRMECVMFAGEDDEGNQRFQCRPIIRPAIGGPPQLGPPDQEMSEGMSFTGRMTHLLAPRKATKQ